MFGIQANDVDVLEKIRSALNSDHPISVSKEKNKATLTIPSKILCKRLNDMGLTHRKTFDCDIEKILEYVPENLERHFVRGMFDGDGGLGIYKYDYFKKHSFNMMFTGVAKTVGYMHRLFGLHTKIINEGNGIFTVTCKDRKKITELGHYMYDDATIYMNRKYAQFNRAYQIYQTEK